MPTDPHGAEERLREAHVPDKHGFCQACQTLLKPELHAAPIDWPCPVSIVLTTLQQERAELDERLAQVELLQQEGDEINVALGSLGITTNEDRLKAIAALKARADAAERERDKWQEIACTPKRLETPTYVLNLTAEQDARVLRRLEERYGMLTVASGPDEDPDSVLDLIREAREETRDP